MASVGLVYGGIQTSQNPWYVFRIGSVVLLSVETSTLIQYLQNICLDSIGLSPGSVEILAIKDCLLCGRLNLLWMSSYPHLMHELKMNWFSEVHRTECQGQDLWL